MTADQEAEAVRDTFSQTLRRLRGERKLSQEDLAELTDMHRTRISALERGKQEPRLQTLIKLSAALEAPLSEFFTGIEWRPLLLIPISEGMGRFHVAPTRLFEK